MTPATTVDQPKRLALLRHLFKWTLAALAAALMVRTLLHADLDRALTLVRSLGAFAPALILPAAFVMLLETIAWKTSLPNAPTQTTFSRLAQIRLATDSLLMSVPGGVVLSEGLMPFLLRDKCNMSIAEATAATATRKWLGTRAHGLYIFLGGALGWTFLAQRSAAITGAPGILPWIVVLSGFIPFGFALFMELAMSRGAIAKRTWDLLERLPFESFREKLRARRQAAAATDIHFANAVINLSRRRNIATTLFYVAAWLGESLEVFVISRALGAPFGFLEVLAFEAGLSLVRNLVFFAPSGIGIQDVGYVAFFSGAGVPDASALGAAVVIVKRSREALWIVTGWLLVAAYLRTRNKSKAPLQ